MKKKENKKGELTTTQLVTIIILIASFVILLVLYFRLNLGGTTNEEICHNSVVLKSTAGKVFPRSIDCKTSYLCISEGSDCTDFSASETVKVGDDAAQTKNEIMKAIADSMSTCWYEFGEGKYNYGSGFGQNHVDVAICSIISFDPKVQAAVSEISYQEFYTYLQNTKKDTTHTYLYYLYGISSISQFVPESQKIGMDINNDKILTTAQYSIVTGVANNWPNENERILKVYIIPTAETNTRLASNREFITTA